MLFAEKLSALNVQITLLTYPIPTDAVMVTYQIGALMNPLLETFDTPYETVPFHKIQPEHFLPALNASIVAAKAEIEALKQNPEAPSFENTIVRLEEIPDQFGLIAGVFHSLRISESNDALRQIMVEFSNLSTEFGNDINLDDALFQRVKAVYDQREALQLNSEQTQLLDKTYKNFTRNGALLAPADKEKLRQLDQELARLGMDFGENARQSQKAFVMEIDNEADLDGLPESARRAAAEAAKKRGKPDRWIFTLDRSSVVAFMRYSSRRHLREKMYRANTAVAYQDAFDNQENLKMIITLRHQRARLLGYATHAHFVLEERMAQKPETVIKFLDQIAAAAQPAVAAELEELRQLQKKLDGIDELQKWDLSYYSEKLRREKYDLDENLVRPYLELQRVLDGVFTISRILYDLSFKKLTNIPVYHPDVQVYEVHDEKLDKYMGLVYLDLFPRDGKKNGAWCGDFKAQCVRNGKDLRPHITIVGNFTEPVSGQPTLLPLDEARTVFHEFGHALHHLMSECTYQTVSGTNVKWDFVELPSKLMENWLREKESLDMFAAHYQTGEKMPVELLEKLQASSTFGKADLIMRLATYSYLDLAWYTADPATITDVAEFEKNVLKPFQLLPDVPSSTISCSFLHIFQGGYSAGYYSYMWSEVLDAEAFELFKEKGIFSKEVADSFRHHILSKGGTDDPRYMYERFRGKVPTIQPFLKRAGL